MKTSGLEFEAASGSLEAASNSKESHSIISISEKKKDKKEKHKLKLVKKSKQADKDTEVENKGKSKQYLLPVLNTMFLIEAQFLAKMHPFHYLGDVKFIVKDDFSIEFAMTQKLRSKSFTSFFSFDNSMPT